MPIVKEVRLNEFTYPHQGEYKRATTILLQPPGLNQFRVHNRMTHYIMQAAKSLAKELPDDIKRSSEQTINMTADGALDDGSDQIMSVLGMGITDGDVYVQFCDDVKDILTGRPNLCRIEGTDAPITEEAWANIAHANGVQGVSRILSVFTSFFMEPMESRSQSANGHEKSIGSASPMTGHLTSPMPPRVHDVS